MQADSIKIGSNAALVQDEDDSDFFIVDKDEAPPHAPVAVPSSKKISLRAATICALLSPIADTHRPKTESRASTHPPVVSPATLLQTPHAPTTRIATLATITSRA
jgi:hypothetical protein